MNQSQDFKVNTFCIGAEKSGTTSLYEFFSGTHKVSVSIIKEPLFFSSFDSDERKIEFRSSKISEYHNLFKEKNAQVVADFTPIYYCDKAAIERIANYNPDAKIILLLRDPFDRINSHYSMMCANAGKRLSTKYLMNRLVDRSLYSKHIYNLFRFFDRAQVCIITFEELILEDGRSARAKLSKFLGLEIESRTLPHVNSASNPRSYPCLYAVSIYLSRLKSRSRTAHIILTICEMSYLAKFFKQLRDTRLGRKEKFSIKLHSQDVDRILEDISSLHQLEIIDAYTRDKWTKNGLKSK